MRNTIFLAVFWLLLSGASVAAPLPLREGNAGKVQARVHKTGSIVVRSVMTGPVQFYLFNVEGRLVYQSSLRPGKEVIKGLEKGSYLYQVLVQDEVIETGKLTLK